jgi:tRNA(Ile)-lysidine synthase TilS/MesJ
MRWDLPGLSVVGTEDHINWVERGAICRILDTAKAGAGMNYDCIVPISGGKDSMYQLPCW